MTERITAPATCEHVPFVWFVIGLFTPVAVFLCWWVPTHLDKVKQWITAGLDEKLGNEQSDLHDIEDHEFIIPGNSEIDAVVSKEIEFLKKELREEDDLDALADEEARNRLFAEKVRARLEALRQLLKQGPADKTIEDKLNRIGETVNEVFPEPNPFAIHINPQETSTQEYNRMEGETNIAPINAPSINLNENRVVERKTRQEIVDYIDESLSRNERIAIKWSIRESCVKAERYKGDSKPDSRTVEAIRFFSTNGGDWSKRQLVISDMKKTDIKKLVYGFDNKNSTLSVYPVSDKDTIENQQTQYDETEI